MTTNTTEQQLIIDAAEHTNHSLLVNARAGSGKTRTLLALLNKLKGSTAALAFNKAIAEELKARAARVLTGLQAMQTDISTAHAAGLSAFKRNGRNPKVLGGKVSFLLKDLAKTVPGDNDFHRNTRHISKLVSHAKNAGFGINSTAENFPAIEQPEAWHALVDHFQMDTELEGDFDTYDLVEWAIRVLKLSNAKLDSIDFDDMIYLPLLLNLNIPQYDNVLVDEAQDLNATRREFIFRMKKPSGRIIAVGDPFQAIYGFTGADIKSLDKIRDRASAHEYTLSICFRCDIAIIKKAQEIVPDIKWREGAGDGQFITRDWDDSPEGDFLALPKAGDAILCRLNKPNVAVALGLIRRGVAARIEGRDLGEKLLGHVKRATTMYALQPMPTTLIDLANYRDAEVATLIAKNRETQADMLEDEVDAATLLIERLLETHGAAASFTQLEMLVGSMFGENIDGKNLVTLSSIHKAKGREWPRVFILGRNDYMPFHRAQKAGGWQLQAEYNLMYVGDTRAERVLIHVNGVQSAIDRGLHRKVR